MSLIDVISDHSNKKLVKVPEPVLEMFNLKMLYLEGNALEVLPDDFFDKLKKLAWLDLRRNRLTTIPTNIADHQSLETLLLQDNKIEELPNELGVVPNLKVLQISKNPIKYPDENILNKGINSICDYLKQEYYKIIEKPFSEEDEERELSTKEPKSSTTFAKSEEKLSVQELLRLSCVNQNKKSRFMPVINVKSLLRTNVDNECIHNKNSNTSNRIKRTHKVTRSCSKISLRSHCQWNNKKKQNPNDRGQEGELKEMWLARLRDLLTDQEKILQQEKNLKTLSMWRLHKKMMVLRPIQEMPEAPYGIDPECNRILSRKDLTKQIDVMIKKSKHNHKKQSKKINIQSLINEVVEQMKNMETQYGKGKSTQTEQEIAEKQIQSIVEFHKKIVALQETNQLT